MNMQRRDYQVLAVLAIFVFSSVPMSPADSASIPNAVIAPPPWADKLQGACSITPPGLKITGIGLIQPNDQLGQAITIAGEGFGDYPPSPDVGFYLLHIFIVEANYLLNKGDIKRWSDSLIVVKMTGSDPRWLSNSSWYKDKSLRIEPWWAWKGYKKGWTVRVQVENPDKGYGCAEAFTVIGEVPRH